MKPFKVTFVIWSILANVLQGVSLMADTSTTGQAGYMNSYIDGSDTVIGLLFIACSLIAIFLVFIEDNVPILYVAGLTFPQWIYAAFSIALWFEFQATVPIRVLYVDILIALAHITGVVMITAANRYEKTIRLKFENQLEVALISADIKQPQPKTKVINDA